MRGAPMTATAAPTTIPAELLSRPQWVAWRWGERDGKPTKIPVNPRTGRNGKTNDPRTWGTHAQAVARQIHDGLAGIGFVIDDADPYTGIDLDDCRDPATEALEPWAQSIVSALASYTEPSARGTGVHVIVRARKPGPRCHNRRLHPGIEIYEHTRLLTFSGQPLAGHATIEDRQEQLAALYAATFPPRPEPPRPSPALPTSGLNLDDADLIAVAMNAKNGALFTALYVDGDISGYPRTRKDGRTELDHSAADQALCNKLAFYCGPDPDRIDRLFRRSALYRPERWDARARAGETYGQGTIARAIASCTTFYSGHVPITQTVPMIVINSTSNGNGHHNGNGHGEPADKGNTVTFTSPDLTAEIARLRAELAAALDRAERAEAERAVWQQRYERSIRERSEEARARRNPTAKSVVDPAIAALHEYRSALEAGAIEPDGFVRCPYITVGGKTGRSRDTAKRALHRVAAANVGFTVTVRDDPLAPGDDQEVAYIHFTTPDTFLADLAETSVPPAPKHPDRWGGVKYVCPDHPGASVLKRTTYHCAVCDRELARQPDEILTGGPPCNLHGGSPETPPPTPAPVDTSVLHDSARGARGQVAGGSPVGARGASANHCIDCKAPCGGGVRCSACATAAATTNAERRRLKKRR